ncbi:hypothetical protein YA0089_26250 [Pseudomonas viridiflava]|uniref:hypothetical protein n=1 Tax=Pseudomonas viridiflava TaxID=33069 RepID=UPI0018E5FECC|nr:hypothetical protein [Pseudomonas viridiflava]MBI6727118.1 hypothetical protein [Pseudomonas viridiflava]
MAKVDFSGVLRVMQMEAGYRGVDPHNVKFAQDFIEYLAGLEFDDGVFAPHDVSVRKMMRTEFLIAWRHLERPDCYLQINPALDRGKYTVFYSYKREDGGVCTALGAAVDAFYHDGKKHCDALAPNAKMHLNFAGNKGMEWLMSEINYAGVRAIDPNALHDETMKMFKDGESSQSAVL